MNQTNRDFSQIRLPQIRFVPLLSCTVMLFSAALLLSACDLSRAAPFRADSAAAEPVTSDGVTPNGTASDGVSADGTQSSAGTSGEDSPAADSSPSPMSPRIPDDSVLDAARQTDAALDRVVSSLYAAVSDGTLLRLDALGTVPDAGNRMYTLREVRVYDAAAALVQTIPADETGGSIQAETAETLFRVRDANYDGADDVELTDTPSDGKTLHTFWLWDGETGTFQKTWTMENVTVDEAARELTTLYQYAKNVDFADTYQFDAAGERVLVRRYVEDWRHGTDDFPLVAYYEFPGGVRTLVRQEFTHYNDEGVPTREVRMQINGELIPVRLEELRVSNGEIAVTKTIDLPLPGSDGTIDGGGENMAEAGLDFPPEDFVETWTEEVPETEEQP